MKPWNRSTLRFILYVFFLSFFQIDMLLEATKTYSWKSKFSRAWDVSKMLVSRLSLHQPLRAPEAVRSRSAVSTASQRLYLKHVRPWLPEQTWWLDKEWGSTVHSQVYLHGHLPESRYMNRSKQIKVYYPCLQVAFLGCVKYHQQNSFSGEQNMNFRYGEQGSGEQSINCR